MRKECIITNNVYEEEYFDDDGSIRAFSAIGTLNKDAENENVLEQSSST